MVKPVLLALLACCVCGAGWAEEVPRVGRFGLFEAEFTAGADYKNPYVEVVAAAAITPPAGDPVTAPLYWDGGGAWRLRFSPNTVGRWTWAVTSDDAGLNGTSGSFECVPSTRSGGLRRMPQAPWHFERQDGSPCWFLGDTAWSLFNDNPQEGCDRQAVLKYLNLRAKQGFNVVHASLLSEVGWGNAGGPPWHDLKHDEINPTYWREVDARVAAANTRGITVGLVLAWGEKSGKEKYPWGRFPSVEARRRYARYVAARYAAYDVYFLVSGEWHGELRRRRPESEVKREFIELGDAFREADAQRRMVGIHPMTANGSTRDFNDARWMDFADYQQNYTDLHGRALESRSFGKPVVNGEYAYFLRDQNGDGKVDKPHSRTVDEIRHATWDIVMAGAYVVTGFGSTYMGGNRHPTAFFPDDPRNAPWELQVGIVKQVFSLFDWWKLAPHDELVASAVEREARGSSTSRGGREGGGTPAVAYWCLAEPGKQYLLYARGLKESVELKLAKSDAPLAAWRIDPRTGDRSRLGPAGGDTLRFTPPDERDWLMIVSSRNLEPKDGGIHEN